MKLLHRFGRSLISSALKYTSKLYFLTTFCFPVFLLVFQNVLFNYSNVLSNFQQRPAFQGGPQSAMGNTGGPGMMPPRPQGQPQPQYNPMGRPGGNPPSMPVGGKRPSDVRPPAVQKPYVILKVYLLKIFCLKFCSIHQLLLNFAGTLFSMYPAKRKRS